MKTLLISLGLTALAGSASAFTRVVIAPPAIVIGGPVCRPVTVERVVRAAPYCAPVAVFRGRTEVVVRGGPVCRPEPVRRVVPVCRPAIVSHGFRR
ncbi:MAG TPA: hypothetical protein VIM69_08245 [Opitutaceae bacterium]